MATPDSLVAAGAALDAAVERLRGTRDPVTLMTVGRLHTRLEAIRALASSDAATAALLSAELVDAIATDLGGSAALHAARGAALLGAA